MQHGHRYCVRCHARILPAARGLTGAPPGALIRAITSWQEAREALLNVAMSWSRPEMSRALLDALHAATYADDQELLGWFLKRTLAVDHMVEAIAIVRDGSIDPEARSWVTGGIEGLVWGQAIGWAELELLVDYLSGESASVLRCRVPGLLTALGWRDSNKQILEICLRDSDPEVLLAAAQAIGRLGRWSDRAPSRRRARPAGCAAADR